MKTTSGYSVATLIVCLGTAACVQAASTIQFSATSYTVAESVGAATLTVQRTGDSSTVVGVDYTTVDGTATNGHQYLTISGHLAFAAGETNHSLSVPILDDGLVLATRTFRVLLSNPTGGAVLGADARTNAIVAITNIDVGVQFQFASYTVVEDAGVVLVGVVRGDGGTLPVTMNFATSDLTATNGLDYGGSTNPLLFAAQERLKFVPVPIFNNRLKQPSRTFRATLSNPVGATLGIQKTTTVTIVDNDQGLQCEFASYLVAEDAGAVRINVLRGTDDTNALVTVDYVTSDLTATNGSDYTGVTNTLAFAPGDRIKLVTVPILNDGIKEPNKNFRLTLSNPTGGAVLGPRTTATVTIVDNDPGVGFERTQWTNAWASANEITVRVLRGNDGALGPISVDYATSNLTALAGQGYQPSSGTLTFNENETVKNLTIKILQTRAVAGTKRFMVTLTNVIGGARLGTASAIVNIVGTYFTVAPPFDTALTIQSAAGLNTLNWKGAGLLQRADRPTGPWQTLVTSANPMTVQSPLPTTFYRVTRPRPVNVYVPSIYDGTTPTPLVILLHPHGGASGAGDFEESYLQLGPLAEARGFLYCYPEGTVGKANDQFWNATDGCCDFFNAGPDDAGYLRALIEEISRQFVVAPKRVYLVGHSNGAFMAYRMACDSADLIAGIASLAGTTFLDPDRCTPSQPVNILQIHGTADPGVPYFGGANIADPPFGPSNMAAFPGALQTVQFWAKYNGASDPVTDSAPSLDLTTDVPGRETVVTRYTTHPPGGTVELWTINGGGHYPSLSSEFAPLVIDWLLSHPKP